MAKSVVVAAIQLTAHSRTSLPRAWPQIAARIKSAAAQGAQLIVLPEGTLPSYVLGYDPYDEGEIQGQIAEARTIARDHGAVLVIGAARSIDGRIFNSALVIECDGSVAGRADKHFLWHFDRQWFSPGEDIAPVQTSIGNIGALVCADGRIPTIARTLVDRGAELLVMPTAWVTSGRDPQNLENAQADLLARVRARENGVPFIAANKCGVELGCVAYCGKSQIVDAGGNVLALASQDREEILLAELTIEPGLRKESRDLRASLEPAWTEQMRVAITSRAPRDGDDALLRVLEADVLVHAHSQAIGDDIVLDPAGLVAARMAGHTCVTWRTSYDLQWQVPFARTRALELRMYVIVIDTTHNRAYAVDPDGTIVCGTFGDYEVASFTFDPAKTQQTAVAPNTDVLEGLQRAQMHALD
jgi:predicted amidohydrolase